MPNDFHKTQDSRMKRILFLGILIFFATFAYAQSITVDAQVQSPEAFVGEQILFQITIQGSESPTKPDVTNIPNFTVEYLGEKNTSKQSISIIYGQVREIKTLGYIFQYYLTPQTIGKLIIPPIPVLINNKEYLTNSITIESKAPQKSEDFKLEYSLDKTEYYIGEPIYVTVTWYLKKTIRNAKLYLPLLQAPEFIHKTPQFQEKYGVKYHEIQVNNEPIVAAQTSTVWKGQTCSALVFHHILFAKQLGKIQIPAGAINFEVLEKRQQRRRRPSFFDDDFFDDSFFNDSFFPSLRSRNDIYKKMSIPSDSLQLTILSLPLQGRPKNFQGYIGKHIISTSAKPTEANVGTPITLTIQIQGPEYLENTRCPDLSFLSSDFKIPQEQSAGKIEKEVITFTQTIRPNHDQIKEIPPIPLTYFDTNKKQYITTQSKPIPLQVNPTKIVTLQDVHTTETVVHKSELEQHTEGIAHNYEGLDLLQNQEYDLQTFFKQPIYLFSLLWPVVLYILILCFQCIQTRKQNKQKQAYKIFLKNLQSLKDNNPGSLLTIFREYFSHKLNISNASLTWQEIQENLSPDADSTLVQQLQDIYETLEATYYSNIPQENMTKETIQKFIHQWEKQA